MLKILETRISLKIHIKDLIDETFVEVKYHYVVLSNSGRLKSYKEILSDYLEKEIKGTNKTTKSGIIVSLAGFSKSVRVRAKKDDIKLIGYEELKRVFEKNKRTDLVLKLKKLKPWTSQLRSSHFSLALEQLFNSGQRINVLGTPIGPY